MTRDPATTETQRGQRGLEREFKFDVDAAFDPPDLRPVVGGTERLAEQHLETTYFDTEDLRLWHRHITLRHRLGEPGGPGGKWTLKLESSADARFADMKSRTEATWTGPGDAVPAGALRLVAGIVRRAPLGRVAVLATERRRLLLRDLAAAEPWAELDDDLVTVTAGRGSGRRFRQLELELTGEASVPGPELEAVLDQLRRAGAASGTGTSKFSLATGLAEGESPDPGPGPSGLVRRVFVSGFSDLLDGDLRLRLSTEGLTMEDGQAPDVESVHDTRAAARTLRSNLRTLSAVLDPVWSKHTSDDLRWVGQALGRSRDAQELAETLSSSRYMDLLDRLHAASERPPVLPPEHLESIEET